ncbi:MAG: sugar ABC transporter ATP-binding protein [Legionellales bacterium RIFCSPHIGHO2_12_FULL_37_14]|nr:MAG: sugar ABC transporter ATP-binding protein [Legionellales bacterium RIFCSPHIGHO2_12_FULL_37_14]
MTLLKVENLGKAYDIYSYEVLRIGKWFGLPFKPVKQEWILRNLSFAIEDSESIAIIGGNGAGKSTLLKLLTGIITPTEGRIICNGSVAAILELGTGFNFELTARQNIVFASQLMGMAKDEIYNYLPEIEEFCELGEYFNAPMRTYSSGMQMRVAFALATAKRPDLLIVDEALAVGDTYFQHKSFQKIKSFQEQGSALLFVSHDRNQAQAICKRAILINDGNIALCGKTEEVFDYYSSLIEQKEKDKHIEVKTSLNNKLRKSIGTGQAKIQTLSLYNQNNVEVDSVEVGEPISLRATVKTFAKLDSLVLGFKIKDKMGQLMYGTNTCHTDQVLANVNENCEYEFAITFPANFGEGSYAIQIALHDSATSLGGYYDHIEYALIFQVINAGKKAFIGGCWLEPTIKINTLA